MRYIPVDVDFVGGKPKLAPVQAGVGCPVLTTGGARLTPYAVRRPDHALAYYSNVNILAHKRCAVGIEIEA